MSVSALVFTDGAVDAGEDRAGCVGYGGPVHGHDGGRRGRGARAEPRRRRRGDLRRRPPPIRVVRRRRGPRSATCRCGVRRDRNVWHIAVHLGARGAYGASYRSNALHAARARALRRRVRRRRLQRVQRCGVGAGGACRTCRLARAARRRDRYSGAMPGVFLRTTRARRTRTATPRSSATACAGRVAHVVGRHHRRARERDNLAVTVPMGETVGRNDERRAGAWYVGVKALAGRRPSTVALSLAAPPSRYAHLLLAPAALLRVRDAARDGRRRHHHRGRPARAAAQQHVGGARAAGCRSRVDGGDVGRGVAAGAAARGSDTWIKLDFASSI